MNTRKIYIAPDGKEFNTLPKLYNNVSPITQENCEALGWRYRMVEISPPAEENPTETLVNKEREFTKELLKYCEELNINIMEMDINITALKEAARVNGATEEQISIMSTALMTIAFDIMSESDRPWSYMWQELKTRIPGYIAELDVN